MTRRLCFAVCSLLGSALAFSGAKNIQSRSTTVSHRTLLKAFLGNRQSDHDGIDFRTTALQVSNMISPGDSIPSSMMDLSLNATNKNNVDFTTLLHNPSPPQSAPSTSNGAFHILDSITESYLGSRLFLAALACLYGTNFPLGSIMNQALPASAATSDRMVLAALALSPFLVQLPSELVLPSILAGLGTSLGYVAQSISLVDTSPATVSFLGAITVIWCPFFEWLVYKTPMSWKERPQTWVSAVICLLGVGILELCGTSDAAACFHMGTGDALAIVQAIGFGTGIVMSEKAMKKNPTKALPVTAAMLATSAFVAMVWSLCDGWVGTADHWQSMALPQLFLDPSMKDVALAVAWTGLVSTSLAFSLENYGLSKVPSAEASVILATEPLWAAAFASFFLGEKFGWNDYVGGFLILSACVVNTLQPKDILNKLPGHLKER